MSQGVQERWVQRIQEMGVTPSIYGAHATTREEYDVPCKELPGIRARFMIVGEGHELGLEPGPYLIVGILSIGVSRYPAIRDAITNFVLEKLVGQDAAKPIAGNLGQGVAFEITGTTADEATILKLKPPAITFYRNIGQIVESGKTGIRISPFNKEFPFHSDPSEH